MAVDTKGIEEQREKRWERARVVTSAQNVVADDRKGRNQQQQSKRRLPQRHKNKKDGDAAPGHVKGEKPQESFFEWIGRRLEAWRDDERVGPGGGLPPVESGVKEEIDFDPSKDEIELPISLSSLQRRQVHGWATQLALFHASSGEDAQRHVIVSKTGVFQGKVLTRGGGHMWYKEGVTAPYVERFALQPGYEEEAEPLKAALRSFHGKMQQQQQDSGFAKWLATQAPGPLDGSDLAQAQESIRAWPLLQNVEFKLVDTPEELASLVATLESCGQFGFDLEAHNARTYHGLTCLLQISTEAKDFIVDPLAEGMWENMSQLRVPFANPDILKIGHSIRSCDVPSLFRDFGIVIINAIDSEEAVHALGDKQTGLAKVLEDAGVKERHDMADLKQTMQTCDWRERPLSEEKLTYARCDSHYLLPLWRYLRARLLGAHTFSNRAEAKEEQEVLTLAVKGHQHDDNDDGNVDDGGGDAVENEDGEELLETMDLEAADVLVSTSGETWHGAADVDVRGSGKAVSPESPVHVVEEHWTTEWDDPKYCHKRERSRSGSFFRSDLESIEESVTDEATCAGDSSAPGSGARRSFRLEESGLTATVLEAPEEDEMGLDGDGAEGNESGDLGDLLPMDLGQNLVGNDEEPCDHLEEFGDDEDEDLWDGWGNDAPDVKGEEKTAEAAGKIVLQPRVDDASVSPEPVSTPAGVPLESQETVYNGEAPNSNDADKPSASSLQATAAGKKKNRRSKGRKGKRALKIADLPNDQKIVHTDGVRLLWKAFSRTQLATAVLWRPAPEARREDSQNDKHFRTAMQRLSPPRWNEVNMRVYEDIYLWRDRTARRMDDGVCYVCPSDILIDVALAMPKSLDELRCVSVPLSPVLGKADTPEAKELVAVVRVALGLPEK